MRQVIVDFGVLTLRGWRGLEFYLAHELLFVVVVLGVSFLAWRMLRGRRRWARAIPYVGAGLVAAGALGARIGQHEFPVRIYGYGLMLVLGFLFGICLARWRARRFGENPDVATNLGLIALVGGVAGARLAFVIERWPGQFSQQADPLLEILNITSGGLIYYGGVALATALVLAYLKWRRLPIRRYLDVMAPSLMIGLAFGRLGCLLNGCCFGGVCDERFALGMKFPYASPPALSVARSGNVFGGASISPAYAHQVGERYIQPPEWLLRREPTSLPAAAAHWNLKVPSELTPEQADKAVHVYSRPVEPAQALAAANGFLLTGLLLWFSRLRRREGQVFALLVILYPVLRFLEESIRGDNPHDLLRLELTHNQYTSVAMALLGLALWLVVKRMPVVAGPYWKDRIAERAPQPAAQGSRRKGTS